MKTATLLLVLAAAATQAAAEDLLNLLDLEEEAADDAAEKAAEEEEEVRLRCIDKIDSVEQINSRCYFKSPFYQEQDRDAKMEQLWMRMFPADTEDQAPRDHLWSDFPAFFEQRANGSFCNSSDSIQGRRKKTIHTQGLIAQVEWEPVADVVAEHGYTGVLETGSQHVIMRLSETANLTEESSGLTPSAAFKFLFNGIQSQNILTMNKMTASDSWNFFEEHLANRVPKFDAATHQTEIDTVQKKLLTANGRPFGLAISHIANKYLDGTLVEDKPVKIPYELRFISPRKDEFAYDPSNDREYQKATDTEPEVLPERLLWYDRVREGFQPGETIYEVHALTAPDTPELGGELIHIANVKLLTDLKFSEAADQFLYFRHRPVHKDFQYYPSRAWKRHETAINKFVRDETTMWNQEVPDVWPMENEAARDEYVAQQLANNGCPFAWLLQ